MHIHVAHPHGEAKYWLEPHVVLANHIGLSKQELADAEHAVARQLEELIHAWHIHFGS